MSRVQAEELKGSGTVVSRAGSERIRWRLVDFWRGVALVILCIDHLPTNPLQRFMPAMLGFSDVAAWFILLSGFSASEAYGPRLEREGVWRLCVRVCKRTLELYGCVLLLMVVAFFIFRGGPSWPAPAAGSWIYRGLADYAADPLGWWLGALALQHLPLFADTLTLYMVLLPLCVPVLLLERRWRHSSLLFSAMLYGSAQLFLAGDSWPASYFNPVAWQTLFVVGMWLSLNRPLLRSVRDSRWAPWLVGLSVAVLVLCLFVRRWYKFEEELPWLAWLLPQWDKRLLEWPYLGHAFVVIFVLGFLLDEGRCRRIPGVDWLCAIGSRSLRCFVAGSIPAIIAYGLYEPPMELGPSLVAVCCLVGTMWLSARVGRRCSFGSTMSEAK